MIVFVYVPIRDGWLLVEAFVITALLVLNVACLSYDDALRQVEHMDKARRVLCHLEGMP